MTALKYTLIVVGLCWALIGMANVVMVFNGGDSSVTAFAAIFNMLLFVFPGLILAGVGGLMRQREERSQP